MNVARREARDAEVIALDDVLHHLHIGILDVALENEPLVIHDRVDLVAERLADLGDFAADRLHHSSGLTSNFSKLRKSTFRAACSRRGRRVFSVFFPYARRASFYVFDSMASPRRTAAKPAIKFVRKIYLKDFRRRNIGLPVAIK